MKGLLHDHVSMETWKVGLPYPACCCHSYLFHKHFLGGNYSTCQALFKVLGIQQGRKQCPCLYRVISQNTGYVSILFKKCQWFVAHFSIKSNPMLKSNRATACCSQTLCVLTSLCLPELFLSLACFSIPLKLASLTHSGLIFNTLRVCWPASSSNWFMLVSNQLFKISQLSLHPSGIAWSLENSFLGPFLSP